MEIILNNADRVLRDLEKLEKKRNKKSKKKEPKYAFDEMDRLVEINQPDAITKI